MYKKTVLTLGLRVTVIQLFNPTLLSDYSEAATDNRKKQKLITVKCIRASTNGHYARSSF